MTQARRDTAQRTPCVDCPLRSFDLFEDFTPQTLAFMEKFKIGEMSVEPGSPLLMEGSNSPQLFTALRGMGVRYKTLESGARQVINFVLPGDFIGLQAAVMGEMKHSVGATTAMTLCVFDRSALWDVFRHTPRRAYDLTWLGAVEEHFLGEALTVIGQRAGIDRLAWALLRLFKKLRALGIGEAHAVPLPFRQQDMADALGLSLVHTNKSLQKLRQSRLLEWSSGMLTIPDTAALARFADIEEMRLEKRPLM